MNIRCVLLKIALFGAALLSGCCSMEDAITPRRKVPSPPPKKAEVRANAQTPQTPQNTEPLAGAGAGRGVLPEGVPAPKTNVPDRSKLYQLELEELAIRANQGLTVAERNQQLQRIWKEQTQVTSGIQTKDAASPQSVASNPVLSPVSAPTEASSKHVLAAQASAVAANVNKAEEPKYATKVPGKTGIIKSPYDGKILDATGFPPGTEVKDPASGRIMLVP